MADGRPPISHEDAFGALAAREPIFHHEVVGASREIFEAATTPDFWMVGASGTIYDRATTIDRLVERYAVSRDDPWSIDDFAVRQLGIITWLATYELTQGDCVSRRSTAWTYVGDSWLAIYHQGTVAPAPT